MGKEQACPLHTQVRMDKKGRLQDLTGHIQAVRPCLHQGNGALSVFAGAGLYQWGAGKPPGWNRASTKVLFSTLEVERRGLDPGNTSYYQLHAAAIERALPGQAGLVRIEESGYTKAMFSEGNGVDVAMRNDHVALVAGEGAVMNGAP